MPFTDQMGTHFTVCPEGPRVEAREGFPPLAIKPLRRLAIRCKSPGVRCFDPGVRWENYV